MADENDVVKLDDKVAAKLDAILVGLNMLKESGVDWKSVFISVMLNVVLLTGFYFFQIKDLATREFVETEITNEHMATFGQHKYLLERIKVLESKLKEHRIGSVGRVGDEGPK